MNLLKIYLRLIKSNIRVPVLGTHKSHNSLIIKSCGIFSFIFVYRLSINFYANRFTCKSRSARHSQSLQMGNIYICPFSLPCTHLPRNPYKYQPLFPTFFTNRADIYILAIMVVAITIMFHSIFNCHLKNSL